MNQNSKCKSNSQLQVRKNEHFNCKMIINIIKQVKVTQLFMVLYLLQYNKIMIRISTSNKFK